MTPEEICRILNENRHDGESDWVLVSGRRFYCSRAQAKRDDIPFMPLSLASAEIIAQHYQLRPTIVCLCGSTRFYKEFQRANYEETMAGRIVLSVGFAMHASVEAHGEQWGCTPEQKVALDELHKRKIDLADEVLVLNVGNYIGDSTRSELEYARAHGKPVRFLEPEL